MVTQYFRINIIGLRLVFSGGYGNTVFSHTN